MTNQTCGDCRHFRTNAMDFAIGECHRYPPTAVPIQAPGGGLGAASVHPPVKRQDDCGEWSGQPLEVTSHD